MDDFTVYGDSFNDCLNNLSLVLNRCIEKDLLLNWEKCHFMVTKGLVLGHIISKDAMQVDRAKVAVIEQLPPPKTIHDIRSFLGHAGFYHRFIKDFSAISRPLCHLLTKDTEFNFTQECLESF